MTAQEVFDTTVQHILKQGRALDKEMHDNDDDTGAHEVNYCVYRSKEGKKCAAGLWITDAEYNVGMETRNLESVLHDDTIQADNILYKYTKLVCQLQRWHDLDANWTDDFHMSDAGEKYLDSVAYYNGLKYKREVNNG